MPFPAMPSQVKCPQCGQSFVTEITTIIDVSEQPELKDTLLRGRLNFAECPQCGTGGTLSTPIIYHDPEKELLITWVPTELGLGADQQEQLVGGLVNAIINSVPAENRKGYFLQPKTALTLESLLDTILEADGVSKEALEAQRARLRLINRLLSAVDDDETLDKLIEEERKTLDYTFFLFLSDVIDAQREQSADEDAQTLESLREKLLERVNPVMPSAAPPDASFDELLELLQGAQEGDGWSHTIALNRARLDYSFFQTLTARIEGAENSGDDETASDLTELRKSILDELDAQQRVVRDAEDSASLLIMRLSEAEDISEAVREHEADLNDVFFVVLSRYLDVARRQGDDDRVVKLNAVLESATSLMEESLPPDLALINKLLRAEHPDGTNAVLDQHRPLLSDAFLETCDEYIDRLNRSGDKALAEHLQQVRGQIAAKLTILRP